MEQTEEESNSFSDTTKRKHIILLDVDSRAIRIDNMFVGYLASQVNAAVIKMQFGMLLHENKRIFKTANRHKPCYLCNKLMNYGPSRGGRQKTDAATIDHVVPIWLLKAVDVFALIVDPCNFQMCCSKCNQERGERLATVGDIRREVGDKVIDRLFERAGIWLADDIAYSDHFSLD